MSRSRTSNLSHFCPIFEFITIDTRDKYKQTSCSRRCLILTKVNVIANFSQFLAFSTQFYKYLLLATVKTKEIPN